MVHTSPGIRLFIGNLSYDTTEQSLGELLNSHQWEIVETVIVTDRETGRSRGFGFAEFSREQDAQQAMDLLDGQEFEGRELTVRKAFERPQNRKHDRATAPVEVERIHRKQPAKQKTSEESFEQNEYLPNSEELMMAQQWDLRGERRRKPPKEKDKRRKGRKKSGRRQWADEEW